MASDHGFAGIECFSLNIKRDDTVILLKFPKNFDLSKLNGKKIDLDFTKETRVSVAENSSKPEEKATLTVRTEKSSSSASIMRPLVQNSVDMSTKVGSDFEYSVTIVDNDISLPSLLYNDVDDLQLEFAYSAQPQLKDLHVHSLPIGSYQVLPTPTFTRRIIRHEFDDEGSVKSHSTKKKRKSVAGDGGSVVSEKKQKKLRKDKE